MRINLIAVGTRMPAWVTAGYDEYARRMPREAPLKLIEIPLGKRSGGGTVERARAEEGEKMLSAIGRDSRVVALEVTGSDWSTEKLARQMRQWQGDGRDLDLLVGGPDGLAAPCIEKAAHSWSLSRLTLPHGLVRVVLAEQLYRAVSILNNHPYHRA